jgi:hypothetical protein
VPQPCRSVKSASEFAVRAIEPSRVVLLEHPGRGVTQPEGDQHRVGPGLQCQRRARVAQLAEPEPLQSRTRERRTPHEPTEGRTPDHASPLGGEHETGLPRRVPSQVLREFQRDGVRVTLDGQPAGDAHGTDVAADGSGRLVEQRMYQLIRQPGPIEDRLFEIVFQDAGAQGFCFTFG